MNDADVDQEGGVPASYDGDVVEWANEQARLLRSGQFDKLDIEHIADEIEDVGKSEQRELESRMAVLLAHLLKWQFQSERRSASWECTIREQRKRVERRLRRTPSLKTLLSDPESIEDVWGDAREKAVQETGLDLFPRTCPWPMDDVLREGWLPA